MFDSDILCTAVGNYSVSTYIMDAYGTYEVSVRHENSLYAVHQTMDRYEAVAIHNYWVKSIRDEKRDAVLLDELEQAEARTLYGF